MDGSDPKSKETMYSDEKVNQGPELLELYCPACERRQPVRANMVRLEYLRASVLRYKDGRHPEIDWQNADVAGDFEYVCDQCGAPMGADMDALEARAKEENI